MGKQSDYGILEVLQIINELFKRYGKKLQLAIFQQEIAKVHPGVSVAIDAVARRGLLKKRSLDRLLQVVAQDAAFHTQQFVLYAHGQNSFTAVADYLKQRFGEHELIEKQLKSHDFALHLKGEGYMFSRSLQADLDKLLQ